MSIVPKETIKVLAEASGIANLNDDVAAALAPDVEYRVREVIQESIKFMRHSKRQKLTADDVNRALQVHNVDPLYGFGSREPLRFRKLPAPGANELFYVDDEELDCMELIKAPLPPIPLTPTYTSHWLAIEGVQPAIPQNPLPQGLAIGSLLPQTSGYRTESVRTTEVETSHVVATGATSAILPVIPPAEKMQYPPAAAEASASGEAADAGAPEGLVVVDASAAAGAQIKPLVKHVLSREMQTYYEKITSTVLRLDPAAQRSAYASLRSDAGLHQLVPYLVQFVADKVTKHLKDVETLTSLMSMVRALVDNPNLFLEPYLHQLMPPVLTCVVGKQLCRNPATDDHWTLREHAASVVAAICRKFGDAYTTLQPRVAKTLLRAFLDPLKPLPTHYGAIHGLMALGQHVLQMLLLPNVKPYWKLLEPQLQPDATHPAKAMEARRCYNALLEAVGSSFRQTTAPASKAADGPTPAASERRALATSDIPDDLRVTYHEMAAIFGDALIPFVDGSTAAAPGAPAQP